MYRRMQSGALGDAADDQLALLGMNRWVGLATAYPDLVTQLNAIYRDQVTSLGFVPFGWLNAVVAANGANGDVVYPTPPYLVSGAPTPGLPSWLDNATNRDIWQNLWARIVDAIKSYAANDAETGRMKLDALYTDAAFWNGLYQAVNVVAKITAPVKDILQGNFTKQVMVAGAVIVGVIGLIYVTGRRG